MKKKIYYGFDEIDVQIVKRWLYSSGCCCRVIRSAALLGAVCSIAMKWLTGTGETMENAEFLRSHLLQFPLCHDVKLTDVSSDV